MSTVTRNVRDIEARDRQALEHVLGEALGNDQQLVISVQSSAIADRAAIPSWLDRQREEAFRQVMEITKVLFGNVEVTEDCDPESPGDKFAVFTVTVPDAMLAVGLEREWVKQVRPISSSWPNFSLSLNVDE